MALERPSAVPASAPRDRSKARFRPHSTLLGVQSGPFPGCSRSRRVLLNDPVRDGRMPAVLIALTSVRTRSAPHAQASLHEGPRGARSGSEFPGFPKLRPVRDGPLRIAVRPERSSGNRQAHQAALPPHGPQVRRTDSLGRGGCRAARPRRGHAHRAAQRHRRALRLLFAVSRPRGGGGDARSGPCAGSHQHRSGHSDRSAPQVERFVRHRLPRPLRPPGERGVRRAGSPRAGTSARPSR